MESLAEEFQRKMDLSDKSGTSSLELSKEGTIGQPNTGILVEEVRDPYQFLESSSDGGCGNSSGKQMSTSDLMQTDVDQQQDPMMLGKNESAILEDSQNYEINSMREVEKVVFQQQEKHHGDFLVRHHQTTQSMEDTRQHSDFLGTQMYPDTTEDLSSSNTLRPKTNFGGGVSGASGKELKRDGSIGSANDRIAALRQQFMSFRKQSEEMNLQHLEGSLKDNVSETNHTVGKVTPTHGQDAHEIRSLLQYNYRDQALVRNHRNNDMNNEQWAKGSLGMISGSIAGLTSEGKNLTEGLEYSSSAIDVASHTNAQGSLANRSIGEPVASAEVVTRQASAAEQEEKMQSQLNDFKFQNSPVGTISGMQESDFYPQQQKYHQHRSHTAVAPHETSQQQNNHLILSGGTSSHYLNQSSLSGSEAPIYKEVSLKFSNKFGTATSDSQKQGGRKEHNIVEDPQFLPTSIHQEPITDHSQLSYQIQQQIDQNENYGARRAEFASQFELAQGNQDMFDVVKALEDAESEHQHKQLNSAKQRSSLSHSSSSSNEDVKDAKAPEEEPILTERSHNDNNTKAILERSQQKIKDLAELMGGSSQFTTSMNMFGKDPEFDDEDDLGYKGVGEKSSSPGRHQPTVDLKARARQDAENEAQIMANNREIVNNYLQSIKERGVPPPPQQVTKSTSSKTEMQQKQQATPSMLHNWEYATQDTLNNLHGNSLTITNLQQTTKHNLTSQPGGTQNNNSNNNNNSSIMESELKSLQSKIMDLENKLSFTHTDTDTNINEELLKSGIVLQTDPFQSIDERQEFRKGSNKRKGSVGGGSTDKARKVVALHNNFVKKSGGGSESQEFQRKQPQSLAAAPGGKPQSKIGGSFTNKAKNEKKPSDQGSKQTKFKMEVDLSSLHGKVHFADDEKFQIPSSRAYESSAKSNDKNNFNSANLGGVSSYMSQKKSQSRQTKANGGSSSVRQTSVQSSNSQQRAYERRQAARMPAHQAGTLSATQQHRKFNMPAKESRSPAQRLNSQKHPYLKKQRNHTSQPRLGNHQVGGLRPHTAANHNSHSTSTKRLGFQNQLQAARPKTSGVREHSSLANTNAMTFGSHQQSVVSPSKQAAASVHQTSSQAYGHHQQLQQQPQQRIVSVSPPGGGRTTDRPHDAEQNILAASNAIYKEAATKVVDLQRQVISLRSKLKSKEGMESENERLKRELNEMKSKYLDSQKRNFALVEENRGLSGALQKTQAEKQKVKSELADLRRQLQAVGSKKPVGFGSRVKK